MEVVGENKLGKRLDLYDLELNLEEKLAIKIKIRQEN